MRFFLLLPWLLVGYSCAAQVSQELTAPTLLSGHLDHAPSGDTVRVRVGKHLLKAPLSPTGDFYLVVPTLPQARFVYFSYARQDVDLYLTPGDQLQLTLDFAHFDKSQQFNGRGAAANTYLAAAYQQFESGSQPRPQDQLTPATTPAQARELADTFRAQRLAYLATYTYQHPLTPEFQQQATGHITLQWARFILTYPAVHQRAAHAAANLPTDYYDFLRQLTPTLFRTGPERRPADNTLAITTLEAYGYRLAPTGHLATDPTIGEQLYTQATADWGDTPMRDQAVYYLLRRQLATNVTGVQAAYPAFRTHNRDSTAARALREGLLNSNAIQPGQVAPPFTLIDATGKSVSLNDFKGKVVYLDFWGTWCAPCLAEMPASETLRQHFAGRDVVFVYISVNDAQAKWQQMLRARKFDTFQAVQLWSPNASAAQAYLVQEYPSYYLIGRDGRFFSSRAPRPSSQAEAIAALEQALMR
jgi:thiol-disulfide isomerase/thioredoxin